MESWLKTQQKEYKEHASTTQSPSASITTEELFTIKNYEKILNFPLDNFKLDFTDEDLKGDLWKKYTKELDNWMNSDLLLGGLRGKKDVGNLEQLLDTLWYLNSDLLADYNIDIQIETLKEASKLGLSNKWAGGLWQEISETLAIPYECTRDTIILLYKRFLDYFKIPYWAALKS